jgi:hypothetical protein
MHKSAGHICLCGSPWKSNDDFCLHNLQGEEQHAARFAALVSAAIPYGSAASKVHGPDAVLRFPPGCKRKRSPTFRPVQSLAPLVPAGGDSGQEQPADNGCLPSRSAGGTMPPLSGRIDERGSRVSRSSCTVPDSELGRVLLRALVDFM